MVSEPVSEAVSEPVSEPESIPLPEETAADSPTLLYQGHGSLRIQTAEGNVIYIDPYAGDGYDLPADLILITHGHYDHTQTHLIETKNEDCKTVTWKEALAGGEHQTFELGYVSVEAVEAGYNRNHNVKECVGYILTLPGGVSVYVSGDTSKTEQMPLLAQRKLDYAFFCCDGIYNMDLEEAAECAELVGAKHNIPYHMAPGKLFDRARAEKFNAPDRLILAPGEEIELV
jgi:L-ascorbate metabolism protein UlaG (beta-lactamase superfamily)